MSSIATMKTLNEKEHEVPSKKEMFHPTNGNPREIDINLYSRQIGAFGLETMGKLIRMKILISGLNGAGIETVKNIILAGPYLVTLHDDKRCQLNDMCSNFYITEDDVRSGRSRAEACSAKLAELNDYVLVETLTGPLTTAALARHNVVVFADTPRCDLIQFNHFCRSQNPPIGFIALDGFGLAASVFVDFGPEFTVYDKDGNSLKSALVENIQQDVQGLVTLHPEKPCPFDTGDYVVFREVKGMTEINDTAEPFHVTRVSKSSFTISDTSRFSAYERDGIVEERKVPVKVEFESLEHCIQYPVAKHEDGILAPDFGKLDRSEQLHFAIQSVYAYCDLHRHLPPIRDPEAVRECLAIAMKMNEEAKMSLKKMDSSDRTQWRPICVDKIDAAVVENVVKFAGCHISPIAACLGGIAAQEIVKFTGKFVPLHQWFYFDAFETLLGCEDNENEQEFLPQQSRYDHQIRIWGKTFQKQLQGLRVSLVGAGALGCEYIKSLALMGCCTVEAGSLSVIDMDRIELSNLNRQFLFRKCHIGASKARVAAEAGKEINPELHTTTHEIRVEPQTENVFNDMFWNQTDIVVNALDNIKSRLYVDSRCVWYSKPLLESGTLGTKGNVQVILPYMTQSYGETKDPAEESIPLCTLRHFPNQIEHTVEWSRDIFQGLFHDDPKETQTFLADSQKYYDRLCHESTSASQRSRLEKIVKLFEFMYNGLTYSNIVRYAVQLFTFYFDHQIAQLLYTFPLDHVTSCNQPFWSGPKRAPTPIPFDATDPLHLTFVTAASGLVAQTFGLTPLHDVHIIRSYAESVPIEPFAPKRLQVQLEDTNTATSNYGDDALVVTKLKKELQDRVDEGDVVMVCVVSALQNNAIQMHLTPIEFDKDDDTNFHVEFIYACANLRARNYRIPECDRHKAQMIAGKIIPAIATTTAAVTGFASLEFLKMVTYRKRKMEEFRNVFLNLALPMFVLSEPLPPTQTRSIEYDPIAAGPVRAKPEGFTTWDFLHVSIHPRSTLRDLINKIGQDNSVKVYILSVGNACLYNDYLASHASRLDEPVKTLVEKVTKSQQFEGRTSIAMETSCCDEEGEEVMLPTLKVSIQEM